jgi:hypothetical protein
MTIDAQGNDTDIIFKGTDGSADTTFLTIDGSAAGAATFNNAITSGAVITSGAGLVIADTGNIGSASDTDAIAIAADGVVTFSQVPLLPDNTVATADIQADAITGAKIADDAINSEHYTDGSIDTAHIADAQITAAKLASGVGVGRFANQLLHVRDEKSSNTAGGSCSGTSDNQRDLNTVVTNEITGASLSSNVITLPAGTFYISASSPTNRGGTNRAHLLNTAASSIALLGTSENTQTADTTVTRSFINGRFTIGSSTTFRIRHYTTAAKSDNGLGIQANDSRTEVYTDVQIWKVS